jgi:hypothetical protein
MEEAHSALPQDCQSAVFFLCADSAVAGGDAGEMIIARFRLIDRVPTFCPADGTEVPQTFWKGGICC